MPLTEEQKFLKRNFEAHARLTAKGILLEREMPKNRDEQESYLYCVIMAFIETSFVQNKIIVKSSSVWDAVEKSYPENL